MFVRSTYRITGVTLRLWMFLCNTAYVLGYKFHHTYLDTTLTAAYVCGYYLQNHRVTLHLWVFHLKGSLKLYPENHLVTLNLWEPNLECSL